MLHSDDDTTWKSIAQFSEKDADAFPEYEAFLGQIRELIEPLLDSAPPDPFQGKWKEKRKMVATLSTLVRIG